MSHRPGQMLAGTLGLLAGIPLVMVAGSSQTSPSAPAAAAELLTDSGPLRGKAGARSAADRVQSPASQAADDAIFLNWLRPLKPLTKVHYSYPLPGPVLERPQNPLLLEYVRLTHAASISGQWPMQRHVEAAVAVCAEVNAARPAIRATLAVNYSPWHVLWREGQPPTDEGAAHQAELLHMRQKLEVVKEWVARANRTQGVYVPVSSLLLDFEQFHVRGNDEAWNAAIRRKVIETQRLCEELFPQARIEWYGRGVQEVARGTGWEPTSYFTYDEGIRSFSCALYTVPEIHGMRETFRRTVALAESKGVTEVTPWIALGAGYRRTVDGLTFTKDWDYDPVHSWTLGAEVNNRWYGERRERFAPWNQAKVVVFYPPPFSNRTWMKHFVAYVRGANGVRELPP